mmetsp:Transcript_14599/g.25866  ORF Transcript_14599/g.25866 Transcript_14599/m.25866 type:complete len:220 (+) Transcript_14599:171-830(+)
MKEGVKAGALLFRAVRPGAAAAASASFSDVRFTCCFSFFLAWVESFSSNCFNFICTSLTCMASIALFRVSSSICCFKAFLYVSLSLTCGLHGMTSSKPGGGGTAAKGGFSKPGGGGKANSMGGIEMVLSSSSLLAPMLGVSMASLFFVRRELRELLPSLPLELIVSLVLPLEPSSESLARSVPPCENLQLSPLLQTPFSNHTQTVILGGWPATRNSASP